MNNKQSLFKYLSVRLGFCACLVMLLWGGIAKIGYDFALDGTAAHYLFYDAEQASASFVSLPYADNFKLITTSVNELPSWTKSLWETDQLPINTVYFGHHATDAVYVLPYQAESSKDVIFVMHYFSEEESPSILPLVILMMATLTVLFFYITGKAAYQIRQQTQQLNQLITKNKPHITFKFIELQNVAEALILARESERHTQHKERIFSAYLSHEVRTPLTQMSHSLSRLQQLDDLPLESLDIISQLAHGQSTLNEISTAILALWQINTQDFKPLCLEKALGNLTPFYQKLGLIVETHITDKATIETHLPLANLLFSQLYRNAMQHGSGALCITLLHDQVIFKNSVSTHNKHTQGTGLGLLLLQQVCEQLHWHYKIAHQRHSYTVHIMFSPK
ncbi:hypothetical protein BGP78_20540 [Pseudoalteromonas sp. MSK9-3]|uniref:HAMP domain-containing histidine kinase n=1 Tax=Pseudoalteromonas sp. MSK9-3 TaxID=1897633 RepID=UPI000E6CCB8F|nr:HAMP domain-containing histidine kinase [Pseudoalteromonas sp. MSK9-3]RJE72398.1 hypothetical protein BGP78_20540 [Pseudoalteromonas sp. MSK9-3]